MPTEVESMGVLHYLEEIAREPALTTRYLLPESGYTRHLIRATPVFEVYCIAWATDAETPYHGHPNSGCWMRVIEGELQEQTLQGNRLLGPGDTGFQKGLYGIHKILARKPSWSLHLYKPAALSASS
jgi:hypothetical protein